MTTAGSNQRVAAMRLAGVGAAAVTSRAVNHPSARMLPSPRLTITHRAKAWGNKASPMHHGANCGG